MKPYHKRFASAAAVAWLLLTGAQARTWTSVDGAKTFEGELRSYDASAGKVTVTLPNGKPLVFMQDKLSADDIAFVKENASKLPPTGTAGKSSIGTITADPKELFKKHDGKPADMSKPVQVFILLGQSNMVGMGDVKTLEDAIKSKSKYEKNLIQFIKALRKDFNAPNAKFVLATLGEAKKGEGGTKGLITDAQLAVDGKKNKEFKGNVATVFSNPFCHGGSGNGHYDENCETYMDVGEEMGRSMVELLKSR